MTPGPAAPAGRRKASLSADYARTEISRWQARSMAISTSGIVAVEHPLAAGAVVLARGGHAVDAAGNVVSLIQSNFADFGSGVVPDARDSRSRAAGACSPSIVRTRTRWRRGSDRCRL